MKPHPHRERVARELHARPFIAVEPAVRMLHLAMVHDGDDGSAAREFLATRLRTAGHELPEGPFSHHVARLGGTHLKWECHAEFSSWTLWRDAAGVTPFAVRPEQDLNVPWLDEVPGALLVAVRVHVLAGDEPAPGERLLASCFDPSSLCGSRLGDEDRTEVWTDFRPDGDGFVRILLHDHGGDARQLGRRVQRLVEIETYRSMALLGLPVAREVAPRIAQAEDRLARLTQRLEILEDLDAEQALLADLMKLSAQSEEMVATTAYRFSASDAYFAIVRERVERLAEHPLGELPTIGGFMARRLSPAMRTCEYTRARQDALAERIARAANLLRTRVDLAVESQNRDLLRSMEHRARLQLRLQQTVEGLSVAAITYYVVGLVDYLIRSAKVMGARVDADLVTGIAVPVVAIVIWAAVRRFRDRIERDEQP